MFKILGGVLIGVFIGSMMMEILKRKKPGILESVEGSAKSVTDKLFNNLRESYDFRDEGA
ncbi:MAG: hypothetical protein JRF63_02995 [Deltaproteobacteria bacterium]|nr:hypothetical protein [Deltaproteobacteria bacterium]